MKIYILCFINILVVNFMANAGSNQYPVEMYPSSVSNNCRNGVAKVYDECSDQHTILKKALRSAKNSGKNVSLVYGSEWCIWCHVFDKYIKGQSKIFDYKWEYENKMQEWKMQENDNSKAEVEAKQLNRYVSRNFVVAHIEGSYKPYYKGTY